jgi:nucleotide-binding universal stress UspA family protein
MTPDHFETIVDGSRAPLSAAYAHNPLTPKTVTVFLDASPSGRNRTAHAVALAQRWDAHLVALDVVFDGVTLPPWTSFPVGETAIKKVIAFEDKVYADAEAAAADLRDHFERLCARSNVTGEFRRIDCGQPAEEAILNSLHSDLVIAGYPEPRGLPTDMPIERVFLASGVPLLVLPNAWQGETIGNKILITWNASREARRTASDAMAFLVAATAVTVLLIDPARRRRHGEEPGADIALQLARHGVHVNVERVISNGASIAQIIFRHAVQSGSDLLVFGAYSHARLRQILLGGTTRTLLAEIPVPIFVSR